MTAPTVDATEHAPAEKWRLPTPPSDEEKWAYFGPQSRWVMWLAICVTLGVVAAWFRFSAAVPNAWAFTSIGVLLLAATFVSGYTSTKRRRYTREEHDAIVAAYQPRIWPSVDVFLPSAGEPLSVLENTYDAVAGLSWPGEVTVYVLDDSARDEVREVAESRGFVYRTRPDRGHLKKAGNLRYGYEQSVGDLIAIFDADFAPRFDFLVELVPHLAASNVGIVQSPQYFNALPQQNWLQRGAGTVQEIFYRWVQPSRDAVGTPICVGTNAIYKREALEAAGGFAQIGHSEDVHTGVALLKAGYETRYVPVNVAKGLCPDELDGFINQQYRWCAGSMSLLADRSFHETKLGFRKKLPFFSGFFYYITTAVLVLVAPLPGAIMLWFQHEAVRLSNYSLVIPVLLFGWLLMPKLLYADWSIGVQRVQVVYSYAHAMAIFDVLRGRTAAWVPTGVADPSRAGGARKATPLPKKVRRLMWVWIPLTQFALWAGLLHVIWRRGVGPYALVAVVICLTSVIQWPILWAIREPGDPRAWTRLRMPGTSRTVRMRKAVLIPVSVSLAVGLSVTTAAALYTVSEAKKIAAALPPEALAGLRDGKIPPELGTSLDDTRTAALVPGGPTVPAASGDPGVSGGGGPAASPAPTGVSSPTPGATVPVAGPSASCVLGSVGPTKSVVDITVDGNRYAALLTQRISFCVTGAGVAPRVDVAEAWDWTQDSPAARVNVDDMRTRVVTGTCSRFSGPCASVITDASGSAVSLAGNVIAAGTVTMTTEISADGRTATFLRIQQTR